MLSNHVALKYVLYDMGIHKPHHTGKGHAKTPPSAPSGPLHVPQKAKFNPFSFSLHRESPNRMESL